MLLERHIRGLQNGLQVARLEQLIATPLEDVLDLFENPHVVNRSRRIRMIKGLFNAQTFPHVRTVLRTRVILNHFLRHRSSQSYADGVSIEVERFRIVLEKVDEELAQKLRVLGGERRRKFVVQRKASDITIGVEHSRKFLLQAWKDGR